MDIQVLNPPGFAGLPDAGRPAPDLASLGLDPAVYFVHTEGQAAPLVVEHATGLPRFRVVGGELVPLPGPAEGQ